MGLVNTGARCTANLIKTFVEQGHNESRYPNPYLNTLYRCYVTGELKKETVKRPSYYTEYFFTLIQEAISDTQDDILRITKKECKKEFWRDQSLTCGIQKQVSRT